MYSVRCNASNSFKPFKLPDACFSLSDLYSMKFAFQWIFKFANSVLGIYFLGYTLSSPTSFDLIIVGLFPIFLIAEALHVSHPLILFQTRNRPLNPGPNPQRASLWRGFGAKGKASIISTLFLLVRFGQFVCLFLSLWPFLVFSSSHDFSLYVKTVFKILTSWSFPMAPSLGWCWCSSPLSTVSLLLFLSRSPKLGCLLFRQSYYVCNWIAVEPF